MALIRAQQQLVKSLAQKTVFRTIHKRQVELRRNRLAHEMRFRTNVESVAMGMARLAMQQAIHERHSNSAGAAESLESVIERRTSSDDGNRKRAIANERNGIA